MSSCGRGLNIAKDVRDELLEEYGTLEAVVADLNVDENEKARIQSMYGISWQEHYTNLLAPIFNGQGPGSCMLKISL